MNPTKAKADPPPETAPRADRELRRRNLRTALLLLVLVLASLASVLYEFGVFGKKKPLGQEKR
jgi:hypothetical protein